MSSNRRSAAGLALALTLMLSASAAAAESQPRVLAIYSMRRDTQFASAADRQMSELLEQGVGRKVDYYGEYIDGARFPEEQYSAAFLEYLRLKYQGKRFDLIVTTHRLAYQFLTEHRAELFGDTPLVFLTDDTQVKRVPRSTGLIVEPQFGETFDLIHSLQPDVSDVFVVIGNSVRDAAIEQAFQSQIVAKPPKFRITMLKGLTTAALEERVKHLPDHSAIFYLIFYQDAAGVNLTPLEYLNRLTGIANRPVYSWVDSALERGVVGGSLVSSDAEIKRIAALASRVLNGESADTIPLDVADLQFAQVDWRQIERWTIDASRIPSEAIVRFREPGLFERYRALVIAAGVVLAAETALILALLFQVSRRRRAELNLRASEARLIASYGRVRDLGSRLIRAQEEERARIARELHDDIGQQVTLLAIDLDELTQERRQLTDDVVHRAREVARSVHDVSHRLYPAKLRLVGLAGALKSLERHGHEKTRVSVSCENLPGQIPEDLSLCLYRVAQEAVQNAVKHSEAREVSVRLTGTPLGLSLSVADDGVGFDLDRAEGRGVGLSSMRERVEPFGADLDIASRAGVGTKIDVFVPHSGRTHTRASATSRGSRRAAV